MPLASGRTVAPPVGVPAPVRARSQVRCPREGCRRVLAETDGTRLYLASCAMLRTATLHCVADGCAGKWTWYPAKSV